MINKENYIKIDKSTNNVIDTMDLVMSFHDRQYIKISFKNWLQLNNMYSFCPKE